MSLKNKSYKYAIEINTLFILLLTFLTFQCKSAQKSRYSIKTENEWLVLENVGYLMQNGSLVWTAGGNFKVDNIKEVTVNQLKSIHEKKLLFTYIGNIPKGFYLARSKPLSKEESSFLEDENDTKWFIEVILKDDKGNTENLYTPITFSAASKSTMKLILNSEKEND
jgi:hypothetical protein